MATAGEIAEQLTALYWALRERHDPTLDVFLDRLLEAVGDLDDLAGPIARPSVRHLLEGEPR